MKKTIGILAHVDAGKTTFAEQVLYHTKSRRTRGRVDHKNSFLDSDDIEKQRGITVFSDQGVFEYNDSTYYIVDTPGHMDFSAEMERAVDAMDYAIVILSAVEGVQAQTDTVWNILRKHNVPVFFFINKTDRVGADISEVIQEIKSDITKDVVCIDDSLSAEDGQMDEFLAEHLAEYDDELLNVYLESGYEKDLWLTTMRELIKECIIYPYMTGSALQDIGIEDFLKKFDMLTYTDYSSNGEFGGVVYKIRHDKDGVKISHIKALTGRVKMRDEIITSRNMEDGSDIYEKGKEVVKPQYDDANYVNKGIALVGSNGIYKLINMQNKALSSKTWKFSGSFITYNTPSVFCYKQNGKWGVAKITY